MTTTSPTTSQTAAEPRERPPPRPGSVFAAMEVPGYGRIWLSGVLWNMTRWQSVFLCSYMVNQLTHSPFLVQMVGAAFFAPMFFGGVLGGVISDRFDRRRTILVNLVLLMPFALLIGLLAMSGELRAWMVYPYMLGIGIGGVVDMTSRRALVYDYVGPERATNAIALETLSGMGGNMIGSLIAGAVISVAGPGEAFVIIAGCYTCSFFLMSGVRSIARPAARAATSVWRELLAGLRYVRREPALISVLGITVIQNVFYFSFMPMVPVFAERLGVNALLTGILAGSSAMGSIVGATLIARGLPFNRGMIYVGGSFIAMAFLFAFAAVPWYPVALVALLCAGTATSGFATMQSLLVMVNASPEMRGRAVGLLSTAIGSLPFSMLMLGALAEAIGPAAGVMASVSAGFLVMLAWNLRYPQARHLP